LVEVVEMGKGVRSLRIRGVRKWKRCRMGLSGALVGRGGDGDIELWIMIERVREDT